MALPAHMELDSAEDVFLQDNLGPTIAEHALQCNHLFKSYVAVPEIVPDPTLLDDQLARFTLWASNMEVFGPLNVSLDYRLRYSPTIVDIIHQLLDVICNSLASLQQTNNSPQAPSVKKRRISQEGNAEVTKKYEDDSSDSDSDVEQAQRAFSLITHTIGGTVSRLLRLSNAVRKSATASRTSKIEQYKDDEEANNAIAELRLYTECYIRFRFPQAPEALRSVLVEANALRLRRLYYQMSHRRRIALTVQHPEADLKTIQLPKMPDRVLTVQSAPIASPKPIAIDEKSKPTNLPPAPVTYATTARESAAGALYAKSTILVPRAKSILVNNKLSFPPVPLTSECPFCGVIVEFQGSKKTAIWNDHVIRDLEPFVCILAHCADSTHPVTFETSKAWMSHMQNAHRHIWECRAPSHDPIIFDQEVSFQEHSREEHGVPEAHVATLSNAARRPILEKVLECPFGDDFAAPENAESNAILSNEALHLHIATHMKQIALLTLQKLPSWNDDKSENIASDVAGGAPLDDNVIEKLRGSMYSILDNEDLNFVNETEEGIDSSIEGHNFEDKDSVRMTLLHRPTQDNNLSLAQSLIKQGTNVYNKFNDGTTRLRRLFQNRQQNTDSRELHKNTDRRELDLNMDMINLPLHKSPTIMSPPTVSGKFGAHRRGTSQEHLSQNIPQKIDTRELDRKLREARIRCSKPHLIYFIPLNKQKELITASVIKDEIQKDVKCQDPETCAQWAHEHAKQLFTILAYMKKGSWIYRLREEGISDDDLPLELDDEGSTSFELRRKRDKKGFRAFNTWDSDDLEQFVRVQWWVMVPKFNMDDLKCREFPEETVLPLTDIKCEAAPDEVIPQMRQSGFSTVTAYQIHSAHHNFWSMGSIPEDEQPRVAIKKLIEVDNEEEFEEERSILEKLGPYRHPHIIRLLSTYRLNEHYHFIFPCAQANLRNFWEMRDRPTFDSVTVHWSLKQMSGLASGLCLIHTFQAEIDLKLPGDFLLEDNVKLEEEEGEEKYGRHGDIKPENVLWFKRPLDNEDNDKMGVLKITDFGLGRFHGRESRSNVDPKTVYATPTYEPPEFKLEMPVSRAYDIWSIACLYLEFVTWLLEGTQAIHEFANARSERGEPLLIINDEEFTIVRDKILNDDNFFTILKDEKNNRSAIVRGAVSQWVDRLHKHRNCSQVIHELLDLVMNDLLKPYSRDRESSLNLNRKMQNIMRNAQSSPEYLLKPIPRAPLPPSPSSATPQRSHSKFGEIF